MAVFSDLAGTLRNTFRIGGAAKAMLDASGVTISRTFTLPNSAGTLKLDKAPNTVSYAASLTIDVSVADETVVTLTGPLTVGFSNGVDGQRFVLVLKQDGTGGRVLTFASSVRASADLPAPTLSTAANKTDRLGFIYNAGSGKYDFVAVVKGF